MQKQEIITKLIEQETPFSSFGKIPLSNKQTSPSYGFGTGSRTQRQKVFTKENESDFKGSQSPGPIYRPRRSISVEPSFKFPVSQKNLNQSYDYYQRIDATSSPDKSDMYRRNKSPTVKFGTESRFIRSGMNTMNINPPLYYPKIIDSSQKHSFGIKCPIPDMMTKSIKAGPGSYHLDNKEEGIRWTIAQAGRKNDKKPICTHETYNVMESIQKQVQSSKITAPSYSFRIRCREMAIFKQDLARQPVTLKIQHPNIS